MNVKKKRDFKYIIIIGVLAATGWFLFQQKPDVRSTTGHSYRWRVQALGRGECEQMDDRKQRAVCRKVVENGG